MGGREGRGRIKRRANCSGIDHTMDLSHNSAAETAIAELRQTISNILIPREVGNVLQLQLKPAYVRAISALCLTGMITADYWTPFARHGCTGTPPTYLQRG
jgi:hypothetical protein